MSEYTSTAEEELQERTANQLRALLDLEASKCDLLLEYEEEWRTLLNRRFAGPLLFVENGPFPWADAWRNKRFASAAVEQCQSHADALRDLAIERMTILGRVQAHLGRMTLAQTDKDLHRWTEMGERIVRAQISAAATTTVPPRREEDNENAATAATDANGGAASAADAAAALDQAVQLMVARGPLAELEPNIKEHAPPSRLRRHWMLLSVATPVAVVLLIKAWKNRDDIRVGMRALKASLAIFVREHITEPAFGIYQELFFNTRASISDEPAIEDTKRSLQRMLLDFVKEKHPRMPVEQQKRIAFEMDMAIVSVEYEKSIINAVKNVMSGDILRMLLIQVQFLKKELLTAMSAIETLTYENEFNLRAMATLPAFFLAWCAYQASYSFYYFLMREKSRKATFASMRAVLLAMERLLNLRNTSAALTRAEAEALVNGGGAMVASSKSPSGSSGSSKSPSSSSSGGGGGGSGGGRESRSLSSSAADTPQDVRAAAATAAAAGAAADAASVPKLNELDLGRFVLLVWQLRRVLQRHARRFTREDLDSMREDLAELTGERGLVSVPQQLSIVQRMQRSYRFLQVRAGGAGLLPLG